MTPHLKKALKKVSKAVVGLLLALLGAGALFEAGRLTVAPATGGKPSSKGAPATPDGQVTIGQEAQRNIGLQVVTAAIGPMQRHLHAAAIVAADETKAFNLRPAGSGRVVAVLVRSGDSVRRGQVLLTYDDLGLDRLVMQRTTAQGELAQALAGREAAQAALRRGRELAGGAIAASEIDRRRTLLAQADATLSSSRGRLAELSQQIAQHGGQTDGRQTGIAGIAAIVAPADGTVMAINAAPGVLIDPSQIIVATVDLSSVKILASIYQDDVRLVKIGGTAVITVSGLPGRRFEAPVRSLGQSFDPRSDTVLARCDLPNPDGMLRPGMIANAELETSQGGRALIVPEASIQQIDGHPVVFVRTASDTFQRHAVELGLQTDAVAEIKAGVAVGDAVVGHGSFALKSKLLQSQIAAGG